MGKFHSGKCLCEHCHEVRMGAARGEQGTMNNSPAHLSEDSFAKDWDSPEDRVYDTAGREAKLLSATASRPRPWRARPPTYSGSDDLVVVDARGWVIATLQRDVAHLLTLDPVAAVDLARALRGQGSELEENWWHLKDCTAAHDWVHSQEVSECDLACHEAQEALARWDEVLAGLGDA